MPRRLRKFRRCPFKAEYTARASLSFFFFYLDVGPHDGVRAEDGGDRAHEEQDLGHLPVPEEQLEDSLSVAPHQGAHETRVHQLDAHGQVHLR